MQEKKMHYILSSLSRINLSVKIRIIFIKTSTNASKSEKSPSRSIKKTSQDFKIHFHSAFILPQSHIKKKNLR